MSNTILSINDWNREGETCIDGSLRCDGRSKLKEVLKVFFIHPYFQTWLPGWPWWTWVQIWKSSNSQALLVTHFHYNRGLFRNHINSFFYCFSTATSHTLIPHTPNMPIKYGFFSEKSFNLFPYSISIPGTWGGGGNQPPSGQHNL